MNGKGLAAGALFIGKMTLSPYGEADAQAPLYSGTVPDYAATVELRTYADAGLDGDGFRRMSTGHLLKAYPRAGSTTFWAYAGETFDEEVPGPPNWGAGTALRVNPGSGENGLFLLPTIEGSGLKAEGGTLYGTLKLGKWFFDYNPSIKFGPGGAKHSASLNAGRRIGKFDAALSSTYGRDGLGPSYARLAFPIDGFYVDFGAGADLHKPSDVILRLSITGLIGESRSGKVKSAKPQKPLMHGAGSGHRKRGTPVNYDDRRHRKNASVCPYSGWDAGAHRRSRGR